VTLRDYLSTVTEEMRWIYGSRTFEIRAVLHDEASKRWTVLYCEEIT
jgi:SPP1 family predicted phage head-tail adaptor